MGMWKMPRKRVDHLLRLRDQAGQDRGIYLLYSPALLTSNNRLKLPHGGANALESLKVIAISRLCSIILSI